MPTVNPTVSPSPPRADAGRSGLVDTARRVINDQLRGLAPSLVRLVDSISQPQDWKQQVGRLHDNQDSVFRRDLQEIKGELTLSVGSGLVKKLLQKIPKIKDLPGLDGSLAVNLKDQTSHTIRVSQKGTGKAAIYIVRFDKMTMVGAGAELGGKAETGHIKQLPGGEAEGKLKRESGAQLSHAMEYSFRSKADAARAAVILERVQTADLADDYLRRALAGNPVGLAVAGVMEGGVLPMANPLGLAGGVNPELMHAAGVTEADLRFLEKNLFSQSFASSAPSRVAAEGKLGLWKAKPLGVEVKQDGALEGRKDLNFTARRTYYYQQGDIPPQIIDRMDISRIDSNKEKPLAGKAKLPSNWMGQPSLDVIDDRGSRVVTMSSQISLAPGTKLTPQVLATAQAKPGTPVDVRLTDLSPDLGPRQMMPFQDGTIQGRRDMTRDVWKIDDISRGQAAAVMPLLVLGSVDAAEAAVGRPMKHDQSRIDRDGYHVQLPFKFGADKVIAAEATLARATGMDDFAGPRKPTAPAPQKLKTRLVVQPMEGINVRSAPNGEKIGAYQGTAFLGTWGETRFDAKGQEWQKVVGLSQDDKELVGWVRTDLVRTYPMEMGAMDKVGRINPSVEKGMFRLYKVQDDDSLWNIAKKNGWDFEALLKANKGHVVNPNRIYRGDSIYVPK
ncbi:LysM peptidoglycan-binding domain-containing protein [Paracoccus contaminans]|nr:LysM domain-containing protein [Paracoccus contaminans]